ncbi:hypothetical protein EX30DRAFT_309668 [Ascodesmis nigricans]|uniref:RBR-type E3 ubiquitin transferase n=1 Tax=Ascodesmis nigricans TaxID=341454 RepID=A0A4S2MNV6_9PEZI|nr:hypothetical protein EX30DRAFT_309668 [Ascodesmis nigricans]
MNDKDIPQEIERLERAGRSIYSNDIPTLPEPDINANLNNGHNDDDDDGHQINELASILSATDSETETVVLEAISTRTVFRPGPWSAHPPGTLCQALAETQFTTRICNTCTDRFPVSLTLKAKCGHVYCRECIIQLFLYATTDETLYPPRCCRNPFPVEKVLAWMRAEDGHKFRAAAIEYEATERTYCSNPTCGVFIIGEAHGVVECQSCGISTCSQCKGPEHGVLDCPRDEALQVVLRIAEDAGWKRCSRCHAMVELNFGCNHITCKCGAHWCYVCSAPWKTCACILWQEANLLARAELLVNRQINDNEPINAVERNQRIDDMRDHLENEDDNCAHPGRWRKVEGLPGRKGYLCEFCYGRHWKFILECRRCFVRACQECRTHRV